LEPASPASFEPLASNPAAEPGAPPQRADGKPATTVADRAIALLEVLLCSDFPTQIIVAQALTVAGLHQTQADGAFNLTFIAALSLIDAFVLVGLILLFLVAHGERPMQVLLGTQPRLREILTGIPLIVVSLLIAAAVLLTIQLAAPSLHTVAQNPFQELLQTRRGVFIFGIVAVVAGGVREEIQRAFLLHRFDQYLGGGAIGVFVVSVAFGAGHYVQGGDAVVATAVLGAFWGVVYLRRRSAIAPMVAHAGFNLLELAQFLLIGR
jgi:membrane protease YdiL (CAAX protease family)